MSGQVGGLGEAKEARSAKNAESRKDKGGTSLFAYARRAWLGVALMALAVMLAGCRMGDPYRYAGESHSEAKAIADRWVVRKTVHPGLWEQAEPEIQSHVLGRDAWRFMFVRPAHGKLCVYVWWDDYRDDDYAVQGRCP